AQTVTVIATSSADSTKNASAVVNLQPITTVLLSPSTAALQLSGTQQFSATVANTSNTAVSCSISPAVGSISNTGLYAAPNSINSAQTVTVTATSSADSTKNASAVVNLQPITA